MACNDCKDLPDNTVVVIYKNDGEWDSEDYLTPADFISDMMISNIKASADGSTISVSLFNIEDNLDMNALDDAVLVFRRFDNGWSLVFRLENITISTLYSTDRVVTDFSDDGDIFVLSTNNYFNDFQAEPLLTRVYNFINGEYILDAQFAENEWDLDRSFLNLLKDNKTIIQSQLRVYEWTDKRFAQYNLIDNKWQRGDSFGEKEGEDLSYNILVSDKDVSKLVTCKTDANYSKEFNPQIEIFEKNQSDAWETTYEPYEINDEYEIIDLDVSDSGDIIALTAVSDFHLRDTLSFVDYIKVEKEQMKRLFRLTYKNPNAIDSYGLTREIDLSPDGTHLLVQKWPQTLLYNMSSLINPETEISNDSADCEIIGGRIFPNPTSGLLTTQNINYNQVNIMNSLGQQVGTQQADNLSLVEYPKGIYFLMFKLNGNSVCNTTIINQ